VVDIKQPISNLAFERIDQIGSHLVYKVETSDGAFIMKGDRAVGNNPFNRPSERLNFPIELMNHVDPNGQSRVLTRSELMAVRNWAQQNGMKITMTGGPSFLDMVKDALMPPLPPGMQIKQNTNYQTIAWSIMAVKVNMLDLLSASEHRTKSGSKDQIRRIAAAFKAPGGLEKMGQILAVDAFSGNNDRLQWTPELRPTIGQWNGVTMEIIINPGNVFLAFEQNRDVILGLDSFDPNTQFGNMRDFQTNSLYPGTYLNPAQGPAREKIFKSFCNDVEGLLGPRDRTFSFQKQTRLPIDAARRLATGWKTGSDKVLAFYKAKYAAGKIPFGMVERFKASGWWNNSNFPKQ